MNAPQADFCEKCDFERPGPQLNAVGSRGDFRRDDAAHGPPSGKNRNRKGKMPKFERMRLGDSQGESSGSSSLEAVDSSRTRVNPGNVWTQNHPLKPGVRKAVGTGAGKAGPWKK